MEPRTDPPAGAAAYLVRRPTLADAPACAALHAHVWRQTYRGLMEDRVVDGLSAEGFTPMWESIGRAYDEDRVTDDGRQLWLAEHDGVPVAFIFFGPPRDEDPPAPLQLWALNVHPDHQGTGIAQRLLDEHLGGVQAYLWVARGNDRAIRFYQRNGFGLDGTESADQHDGVVEVRMVRS